MAAPVITTPAASAVINNRRPVISGTATPGSVVTVQRNAADVAPPVTAHATTGAWSVTPVADLSTNANTISVTSQLGADPVEGPTTRTFTIDITPPVAPVISTPAASSIVPTRRPVVTGTREANATVTLSHGSTVLGTASGAGTAWSITSSVDLPSGDVVLSAVQRDVAGNVGPAATRTVRVRPRGPKEPLRINTGRATVFGETANGIPYGSQLREERESFFQPRYFMPAAAKARLRAATRRVFGRG